MASVTVNGIRMHYQQHGAGEPLLLLHGLGSSSQDWELQYPAFAAQYRVIAPDLRGHGRTDKPPGPYSIELFASDALALLDALDVPRAHVVGISMGGMVAFQMAVEAPHRLASLIIVNSAPSLIPRSLGDRLRIAQRFLLFRLFGVRGIGRFLAGKLFPKPEHAELRQVFVQRWSQNDPRAYEASMRALFRWSVEDRLAEIRCPTLVVAADQDYSPVAHKEAYAAKMANARVAVVEDSRHATPVEKPEVFNALVLQFLGAHPLAAS